MSWASKAACVGKATLFFGGSYESDRQKTDRERRAKKVCESCPVLTECRDEGAGEKWGVWGGRTERERGYNAHQVRRHPYNTRKPKGIERVA